MLTKENLAATLMGKEDLRLVKDTVCAPGFKEVIIELRACGLCGTDIHLLREGRCGDVIVTPENPLLLGHECSGVITAVGEGVTDFKVGDRVAPELSVPCRTCERCLTGRYNLCKGFSSGGLARYLLYPADMCHRLPDGITFEDGALLEPLAVSVHACRRAGVSLGCKVLVCGAGTIGLTTLMTAKAMGAETVCITDISQSRLNLAKELGATHTVLVDPAETEMQLVDKIMSLLGGHADFSIECSGVEHSINTAAHATKNGGAMVPVALEPDIARMPLLDTCIRREVDIKGSFSYGGPDYPMAISMIVTGRVNTKPLVTNRYPLPHVHEALDLVRKRDPSVVKVIVECNKS